MAHVGKNGNVVGKQKRTEASIAPIVTRGVRFAHKGVSGQTILDLTALTTPSEMTINGFVQPSTSEILACRISANAGNLKLRSLLRGPWEENFDYKITNSGSIQILIPGGLQPDEIIVGKVESGSDIVPASVKPVVKTYAVAAGQTLINLGQQYKVNENPTENAGAIRVFIKGIRGMRNTGNSSVVKDKDYYEIDSGDGYGTTFALNYAYDDAIDVVVDFGGRAITDSNAIDAIDAIQGSIQKIATDLAILGGNDPTEYTAYNPSTLDRRTFGDTVLLHKTSKAEVNGDATKNFAVKNAVASSDAVALGQFVSQASTNGYLKFPGGITLQWGQATGGDSSAQSVTFPTPFTTACFQVVTAKAHNQSTFEASATSLTTTGFTLVATTGGTASSITTRWFAIGL